MQRFLIAELRRAVLRLAVAFGLFGLISRIPWPAEMGRWMGLAAFATLAAVVIVISGTLLYNTLFYDHYWRKVDTR